MLNHVMFKIFVAAACLGALLACDAEETPDSGAVSRSETVECLDPSNDARVRMSVQVISEEAAERRLAASGGVASRFECQSSESTEEDNESAAPPSQTDLDRTAPPSHSLASGFCIEVCCGGKYLCFAKL